MEKTPEIIFTEVPGEQGKLGLITLNRPEVLNALSGTMFLALDEALQAYEAAGDIKAVVIRAVEGRAFCAGGDIRRAYELGRANLPQLKKFFADEYRMDARVYHFSKPYISLLDGITMGGGAGISMHGSHRVGTPRLSFAMPETGIGFFPDVGASFFLPRLPFKAGFYLGLTGARIAYNDCLALGLVDYIVGAAELENIIDRLAGTPLPQEASVNEVLKYFAEPTPASELLTHQTEIETCFGKATLEEIFQALEHYPTSWCEKVAATLYTKSPTSLKVTLRLLQNAKALTFDECMALDYRLTCRFMEGHDFYEGVRAAIIDKDQNPHWQPAHLQEVYAAQVEKYFLPLSQELFDTGLS